MRVMLGVDAGNTKTIALLASPDGTIRGAGRAGCGDIYDTTHVYGDNSPDATARAALASVDHAVNEALAAAGVQPVDIAAAGFNMAGADWPEDFDFLRAAMAQRHLGEQIVVVNDAIGALRAGSRTGTGVAVVCGTGAAVGARAAGGRTWHTSHWQEHQGGHELGRKTLRAIYRAELGIDPPTALTAHVLRIYGAATVEELLHLFTAREVTPPTGVAGLAPILLDEARRGDTAARAIVQEHGAGLGDYALAAARRVGIEHAPFTLVLAGGVLRDPSSPLATAIIARVRSTSPAVQPTRSHFEPAVGALFLAFDAAGIAIDDRVLASLVPSLPPAGLFAT